VGGGARTVRAVLGARGVVLAGLSLLLTACGGSEEQPLGAAPEELSEELVEEPEAPAEGAPDEMGPEDGTAEEEPEEGGIREHRPPEEAASFADCGSIDDDDPGAVIRFPSEDVPGSLDAGTGPSTVEVVGCGNTFEANVQWEAYHGENRDPTLEGHATGGTMGDWRAFSITETYWTPGDWTVVVFEIDAESGERVEYDQVTFSVG
jgi:hypothetical protein